MLHKSAAEIWFSAALSVVETWRAMSVGSHFAFEYSIAFIRRGVQGEACLAPTSNVQHLIQLAHLLQVLDARFHTF